MKESETATQQKLDYKKYYEDYGYGGWRWCPLFGALPNIPEELQYPDSIASRCITIIDEARLVWGLKNWSSNSTAPDPDAIKKQTGFSKKKTLSARAVCCRSDTILFNARFYSGGSLGENAWVRVKGKPKLSVGADQADIDKLRNEVNWTAGVNSEFRDYEILLLLAISEAWFILEALLYYDEAEDSLDIIKDIRVVESLLARSKEIKNQKATKLINAQSKKKKDFWENKKPEIKARHQVWKDKAKEICERELKKRRPGNITQEKIAEEIRNIGSAPELKGKDMRQIKSIIADTVKYYKNLTQEKETEECKKKNDQRN